MPKFPAGARVIHDGDLATVIYPMSNTGFARIKYDPAPWTNLVYAHDLTAPPVGLAAYPVPALDTPGGNNPEVTL